MRRPLRYHGFRSVGAGGLILLAGTVFAESIPDEESPEFPVYVMEKIDDLYRGGKSHGIMEMEVKTKHWTRTMQMESWSLGTDYSLVRILEPKKERGTATLKADNDLFTYLNKTGRTIKIGSGMMGGSWMGSHFTNDDLVKHTRLSDDFDIDIDSTCVEDSVEVYHFSLIPHPDAPVVWGKIETVVRTTDLQPIRQLYYDEDSTAVRHLEFTDHDVVDGRLLPLTMKMIPLETPEEYTMVRWRELEFDVDLSERFFTLQNLRSM